MTDFDDSYSCKECGHNIWIIRHDKGTVFECAFCHKRYRYLGGGRHVIISSVEEARDG